jgi:hypothetical protein
VRPVFVDVGIAAAGGNVMAQQVCPNIPGLLELCGVTAYGLWTPRPVKRLVRSVPGVH